MNLNELNQKNDIPAHKPSNELYKKCYLAGMGIIIILILVLVMQFRLEKETTEEPVVISEESISVKEEANLPSFEINEDIVENYANNLNPQEYAYYNSWVSDFNFSYPQKLYNKVDFLENQGKDIYGNLKQQIAFSGEKGSQLVYKLWERTDVADIATFNDYIHSREKNSIYECKDLLFDVYETDIDTHGKIIITGWLDEDHTFSIYDMVKTEENYVMQMKIIWPISTDADDEMYKDYILECIYRMCGFSDSSKSCRSYADFKEASNSQ